MKRINWRNALMAVLLSCVLLVGAGCSRPDTSPYAQAQQESTERGAAPAVADEAEKGGDFNAFFPASADGYNVVFSQEKKGFAEAKLKQDGQDVAMLAVSDTVSLPAAAAKYQSSTEKLAGYPVLDIGDTQTGLLVGDRFQVKVIGRDPSFTPEVRREWLQKFDLAGLESLT